MHKRRKNGRKTRKIFVLIAFSAISFFSLSLGMGLMLMKSPQNKADIYLAMAKQVQEKASTEILQPQAQAYLINQSHELISQAIKHNPYESSAWQDYAQILAQKNQIDKAMQARDIAVQLGLSDPMPVTAMQNLLPERNFALSDSLSSPQIMMR